jgi:hypothetical protein
LARISKLYSKRESPAGAAKQVFSGRFTGKTPEDMGGAGSYTRFNSPLGSTSSYVERFRGSDDLESGLAARPKSQVEFRDSKQCQAADRFADLVARWLAAELGRDPNFPRLKKFLDGEFRRDLRNIAAYAWTRETIAALGVETEPNGEFLVRAGQYLIERGYFSPKQVAAMAQSGLLYDATPLLPHVQRFLAWKMGIPDDHPIPASLDFLGSDARLYASLEKHGGGEHGADSMLEDLFALSGIEGTIGFNICGSEHDSLDLKLLSGKKPFHTNGKWDEKAAAVIWSKTLAPDQTLPAACFAFWSTPDRPAQEQHFGKVVLTDELLAGYAVWYCALSPAHAKEWDRFVGGLKPGPGLKAAIEAFRFSTDPKPSSKEPERRADSLADTPRTLILEGLVRQGDGAK